MYRTHMQCGVRYGVSVIKWPVYSNILLQLPYIGDQPRSSVYRINAFCRISGMTAAAAHRDPESLLSLVGANHLHSGRFTNHSHHWPYRQGRHQFYQTPNAQTADLLIVRQSNVGRCPE